MFYMLGIKVMNKREVLDIKLVFRKLSLINAREIPILEVYNP